MIAEKISLTLVMCFSVLTMWLCLLRVFHERFEEYALKEINRQHLNFWLFWACSLSTLSLLILLLTVIWRH